MKMGEVPIFTCKAHVFLIDPDTKKSWVPASRTAVPVNFFYDSARRSYRIISVDGSKAIINSTVIPDMVFTKTSAKFGQWADVRAGTVYGLGFNSDAHLMKFSEHFDDIRDRAAELKGQMDMKEDDGGSSENAGSDKPNFTRHKKEVEDRTSTTTKPADDELLSSASDDSRSTNHSAASEIKNLRYQNERLKQALAQSSSTGKKWETELHALKNTNSRLTTALQESMMNVDQWHRQLAAYKDENEKLKKKIGELERQKTSDMEVSEQLETVRQQMNQLQLENNEKSQECNILQQRVGLLAVIERQHQDCPNRTKKAQEETQATKAQVLSLEERLAAASLERNQRHLDAQQLLSKLAGHLTDITEVTQKLQSTI